MKRIGRAVVTAVLSTLCGAFAQNPITLFVSAGGSGSTFEAAANHFTEATGIPVTVIQSPYAEVREKQLLELATGTGNVDVVSIDGRIWLAELQQFLEPLDESALEIDHLTPSMVDIFRDENTDELYGLPVRIGGWVLIYREDLFTEAGIEPPQTWEEFLSVAQRLTQEGVYGFAPALRQGNYLVAQWAPFLFSHGGDILTPDLSQAAFNTEEGRKATQFLVDLYRVHEVVPPGAISYEHSDVITAMQQGLAAMALTYSPYFLDINDPEASQVAGEVGISATIPYDPTTDLETGVTLISGWGFGVAESSQNKETALEFIQFITSPEEQLRLALENVNAPTSTEVYENPDYLEEFPAAPQVLSVLSNARDRPSIDVWTSIEDVLARELSMALTGDKTVEQALQDAESEVNRLLQ